jgi:hypothetical protein
MRELKSYQSHYDLKRTSAYSGPHYPKKRPYHTFLNLSLSLFVLAILGYLLAIP